MLRFVSILLFIVGGWMLMTELVVAFIDVAPGVTDHALLLGVFAGLSGVPLLLAALASPGNRWQELGLTILLSAGAAAFCGAAVVLVLTDPGARQLLPPETQRLSFAPLFGGLNMVVTTALGWLLYRRTPQTG